MLTATPGVSNIRSVDQNRPAEGFTPAHLMNFEREKKSPTTKMSLTPLRYTMKPLVLSLYFLYIYNHSYAMNAVYLFFYYLSNNNNSIHLFGFPGAAASPTLSPGDQ